MFYNANSTAIPTETGHIWCGKNGGLHVGMNTAQPIRFSANRFTAGAVNSIEILGTGTQDADINATVKEMCECSV